MKAKHISKLRKEIRHYYVAIHDNCQFGFKEPCSPSFMKQLGYIIYGRDEADAIERFAHLPHDSCFGGRFWGRDMTYVHAEFAIMPADAGSPEVVTYWRTSLLPFIKEPF